MENYKTDSGQGAAVEDNPFVVTREVEIEEKEKRPLGLAFLDVAQAHDAVETQQLWSVLRTFGMKENFAPVHWGCRTTNTVEVSRGLGQGCPLSPLLFTLLVSGLEKWLTENGLGFDLN